MMKKLFLWLVFFSIGMQAQNVAFADANFKQALLGGNPSVSVICYDQYETNISLDRNNDGEIQLTEAALIHKMVFFQRSNYSSLEGINSFINLESIYYENDGMSSHIHGKIGDISLEGLNNLKTFNLSGCDIKKISIKNCSNIQQIISAFKDTYNASYFDLHGNTEELEIENCPRVDAIKWTNNNIGLAKVSDCPNLLHLELRGNSLKTFDASQLINLEYLDLSNNQQITGGYMSEEANFDPSLTSLNINGLSKLRYLNVSNQLLSGIDLTQMSSLKALYCSNNKIKTLNVQACPNINALDCSANQLTSLDVSGLVFGDPQGLYLGKMNCSYNQISSFNSDNATISDLKINNNKLTALDVSSVKDLKFLDCSNNQLLSIKFNNIDSQLTTLLSYDNQFESLDLSMQRQLYDLDISKNKLKVLDLTQNLNLESLTFNNNPELQYLLLKNGKNQVIADYASPTDIYTDYTFLNTNVKYICADDSEIQMINAVLKHENKTASVNSYCSFTPGGNYNTIAGTARFDANSNGCDNSDKAFEFLKLKINDGTNSGETFSQNDGKYEFYTQAGNFTITPQSENPGLFSVSPATFSTDFSDNNNNVFTQDICVSANGNQNDAEVIIAPLTGARPGFDATYKLVWRNKGNTTLSGKVILNFDSSKMTFVESLLPYSAISNGSLEFDYTNLKPFANDATEITFKINTPTNPTNPVNSGDILAFHAKVTPSNGDLTVEDNSFAFNHTVVNSFDPNDIVCMEGETIPSVAVGKYMHYVVNFENVGTAEAENIVVKMEIDPAEFDVNTLQLQNASADVSTVITGNLVEFLFKKIKLKSGGHGNVLLKMKSTTNLQEGDQVNNKANIYFDYNFPVETNDYVTTVQDQSSVLAAKINYSADDFTSGNYPVNFDAGLSTGNITSYNWKFSGNPSVSSTTSATPVVTYSIQGNYTAKLTIYDGNNNASSQTISFKIGDNLANLSTGKDSNGNFIGIDSDEDDWKGYDINGTLITPKVRHTYNGWSSADIGNGNTSQWITLNTSEGYSTYKSIAFTVPENATDAKLNLKSLSFTRNWTYLVKINPDGSEDETEITRTQFLSDGAKGWLNSRSPKVNNYGLSPGRYYIKVLVYSSNGLVRQSLDVNALVSCSAGLMYINKKVAETPTLNTNNAHADKLKVYPIPTKEEVNIVAEDSINHIEIFDAAGRIVQKQIFSKMSKNVKMSINAAKGVYYLKIKTTKEVIIQKIIKE